jgi:hypothetical protein
MKTLKFRSQLADLVLQGKKTKTWRIFDEKNLSVGDKVQLIRWETGEPFGEAIIEKVVEKKMGQLTSKDKEGHEKFSSDGQMYKTYSKYYGKPITKDTLVKVILLNGILKR